MIYSYLDKNVKISTVKSAYVAGLFVESKRHVLDINCDSVFDTGFTKYGLYIIENYSNGSLAVYVADAYATHILFDFSLSFTNERTADKISFYRESVNGSLMLHNGFINELRLSITWIK